MLSEMKEEFSDINEETAMLFLYGVIFNLLSKCFSVSVNDLSKVLLSLKEVFCSMEDVELESIIDNLLEEFESNRGIIEEYSMLFEHGKISLYESDYVFDVKSPNKLYLKADVSGFYKACGMRVVKEMPDHISVELEFLSLLCFKEAYAVMNNQAENADISRDLRNRFIKDHLDSWLDKLLNRLRRDSDYSFYIWLIELVIIIIRNFTGKIYGK